MCKEAVTHKIDLSDRFHTVLQGEVKPSAYPECPTVIEVLTGYDGKKSRRHSPLVITQCCVHELYLQGRAQQAAVDIAKSFERRKCNHKEAIPGDECLQSVIGSYAGSCRRRRLSIVLGGNNKHRYVVATQLQPLRAKLRAIPATPLVHITRSVMILEPPSDATLEAKEIVRKITVVLGPPDFPFAERRRKTSCDYPRFDISSTFGN